MINNVIVYDNIETNNKGSYMKNLIVMFMLCATSLCAEWQIFEADGRAFLLEKDSGVCYRYFYNANDQKQGWGPTFYRCNDALGLTHKDLLEDFVKKEN